MKSDGALAPLGQVLFRLVELHGGEIWFDGKLISKDGVFLPKSLAKLNG